MTSLLVRLLPKQRRFCSRCEPGALVQRRQQTAGVSMSSFRALVLSQGPDRKVSGAVETLSEDKLPAGDVTVAVEYSTLNYKDGLVLTSGGGLGEAWPHVGCIQFPPALDTFHPPP